MADNISTVWGHKVMSAKRLSRAFMRALVSKGTKRAASPHDDDGMFATLERIETARFSVRQLSYGAEAKRIVSALHLPYIRYSISLLFRRRPAWHPFVASRKQENL